MRVKKFQAVDMPEALRMIKEELGPDAVILSTRQIKPGKGVFGLLGRSLLEVTAASDLVEEKASPLSRPTAAARGVRAAPETREPSAPRMTADKGHGVYLALQAEVESLREELSLLSRRPSGADRPSSGDARTLRELKSLEEKVDRLLEQTARFDTLRLTPGFRRLHDTLEARDLDPALVARILTFLQEKLDRGAFKEGRELEAFRQVVQNTVRVSGGLLKDGVRQRVVALVGPTGVGKTTTVAKLAALHGLKEGRRVGLVTVDTYRIAAVEQLKTYAKIMGLPLRVAVDASALRSALEDSADRELVLIDTAGQSPRDEQSLLELLDLFPQDLAIEVHLVLSVTTRAKDLEKILRHYAPAKPSRLLLTKLDETDSHGPLLGLPLASRLPLSYLTTGQSVPDDIEEATPARVAEYLIRGLETVET